LQVESKAYFCTSFPMIRILYISLLMLLLGSEAYAQTYSIRGKAVDAINKSAVTGASVSIRKEKDSGNVAGILTDTGGRFVLTGLLPDKYVVKISFFGYKPLIVKVQVVQQNINLGSLKLGISTYKEITVKGHQVRAEQIGDTVQYNADAFKTNPDATAEDLVNKMPGIIVNTDGSVQAHGETVKQVLVDGKPFFGDDPTTALRNLPAEVIDKVQVYDKLSDQAAFTGFDDGNSQKTINIVTKKYRRNGQFGKIYGGYGTDGRYNAGETFNDFDNNFRLSVISLSNNVNQQNFATQDLLGVMGSSGQRGGGGRAGAGINSPTGGYGGGASNNFLVGSQNGINKTNSIGVNFSDSIGKKTYITASYFFNNTDNNTQSSLARQYFATNNIPTFYNENDQSNTNNYNHRANVRLEYTADSSNSLIFTPKISYQQATVSSSTVGTSLYAPLDTSSATNNTFNQATSGYDFNANLLWRHKFAKKGRTFSWNVGVDVNPKAASDTLHSVNQYYRAGVDTSMVHINQQASAPARNQSISTNLAYTEPIGDKSMIQVNYNPSFTQSSLNQETYVFNALTGEYTTLDSALSNEYSFTTLTNKAGLSYHYRGATANLMIGANYQVSDLEGSQTFPVSSSGQKSYLYENFLPTAIFNEKFEDKSSLRLFYLTSTNLPSITQLQNVVNNTNPLLLSTGNPELKQSYNNTFIARYGKTNTDKAHSFFLFFTANLNENYIGNSTIISNKDSTISGGYKLAKGAQLTYPVNLNNDWSTRAFATYGIPFDFINSNLNFNGGVSYNSTPGLLNYQLNYANTYALNPGVVLSSNISENLDFTLSYNSTYNIVKNTLNAQANANYFTHLADLKFNWIFWRGFTFNTEISHTLYTGLGTYDQSLLLVNGGIAKKFLKGNAGEIKLFVFDALNQNVSIARTVTAAYVDDVRTAVLQRYFMLSFTYTLRHYTAGGVVEKPAPDWQNRMNGGVPPGGPPVIPPNR